MEAFEATSLNNIDWKAFATSILSQTDEGIAWLNAEGRILYGNTAFLGLIQKPAVQLQGRCLHEVLLPETAPAKSWTYETISDYQVSYHQQTYQVKLIPSFTEDLQHTGTTAILKKSATSHPFTKPSNGHNLENINQQLHTYIEEREELEAQLQQNRYFTEQVTDMVPCLISVYHMATGNYLYLNKAIETLLGYSRSFLLEKGVGYLTDLIHPDDLPDLVRKNNEALQRANIAATVKTLTEDFEYRIRHSDGSWRWIHTTGTIFSRDAAGQVEYVLNVSIDITAWKEAEYFIESITQATPYLLYIFDIVSHTNIYANREMAQLLGYEQPEIQAMGEAFFQKVLHPDDQAKMPQVLEAIQQLPDGVYFENEFRLKDVSGAWRWVSSREVVFKRNDRGEVVQLLGSAQDITERKLAEEKLLESQHFIRQVTDAMPDVLYVYDLHEKKTIYINQEIHSRLGYTPEEFYALGSKATQTITHPEDLHRRQAHFEKINELADGEILEIEYRVQHRNGEWLWVLTRDTVFKRTAGGVPSQLIGISQDITLMKRAEERLKESQHFIEQITETSPDHLYVFDLSVNRVVYINREITHSLGYSPRQLYEMGENVMAKLMHPDDLFPVSRHLQSFSTAQDRDVKEIEYRIQDIQGRWHWILARETIFKRTAEGVPYQIVGISRDITDKKQAEEELRYKNQLIENMIASFPVILTRIDKNGMIQEIIGQGLRSFELADNQLAGYNVFEQNQQMAPYIGKVLQGEKVSFIFEHEYQGRKKYFQCYYFFNQIKQCASGFSIDITEQKETEEKLKRSEAQLTRLNEQLEFRVQERTKKLADSEERYRSLTIASSSIVWRANSQGEMTEENKQWEQFTGQTFEQYRNLGWIQAIYPADRVKNKFVWTNAFLNKVPVDTECRLLHHSGQYRYMAVRAVPIITYEGEIEEWIGTCTDIHDRKMAEEALRKSEERYEIAASVTHDAIWDWDLLTNELTYTAGYYAIFGYADDEVQGTIDEWYSHIHPDDVEQVVQSIQAAINSGETLWTHEYRHLRKDGSYAYVYDRGYVQHDASGKPIRMVGAMADITEQRKVQQSLALSEERFRLVSKATNDVVWDWDLINETIWWNEGLRLLFGYKPEEVESGPESWYNRIHPEDMERVLSGINHVIDSGGEQWSDEYRFQKADGTYAFVLDRGYILHDEHGKSIRMIGSMVDITYMKETQEALEQQAQELKQSNADLEQFAYISSHDLQEPLNTASSFAKLLARKYQHELGTEGNEFIQFIVNATDRMKLLIRSLLDYSKINSSGRMLEATDITNVLSQVQENLKATIVETDARILVGPMPVVQAISLQMIQLFQNLISNAIKFRSAQTPEISIDYKEGENHYLFILRDNGIGMDMKYAGKIFQVFQRLHSRDEYEGAGIGLATCKRIVERHGGLIWVESEPGKGSVFYFTIRK